MSQPQIPGPGVVYSTGYALGAVNIGAGVSWNQTTATLSIGLLDWPQLPPEARAFPLVISLPGRPPAGARVLFSLPQGYTIPANFQGTTAVADVAATENAVLAFSIKRAGAEAAFGTITFLPAGGVNVTLSQQAAYVTQPGDVLIMTTPGTQDATLAGVAMSLLLMKA